MIVCFLIAAFGVGGAVGAALTYKTFEPEIRKAYDDSCFVCGRPREECRAQQAAHTSR